MSTELRERHRSSFFVRWDAVLTVIVASCVSFVLGMGVQYYLDHL